MRHFCIERYIMISAVTKEQPTTPGQYSCIMNKVFIASKIGTSFRPNTLKQNDSFSAMPEKVTNMKPSASQ